MTRAIRSSCLRVIALLSVLLLCPVGTVPAKGKWVSHVDPSLISEIVLRDGELYIASSGGLVIYQPADSSFEQFTNTIGLPSNFLTCLAFDNSGSIWVGTEDAGIARLDATAGGFDVNPLNSTFHGLSDDRIKTLTAWGDTIVYGTRLGAGLIIQGFPGPRFFVRNGLPDDVVNDVFADGDVVWIATEGGVAFLDKLGFIRQYSVGLPDLSAKVFARADTAIWVGTANGAARFNPADSTWVPEGIAGEAVFSLSYDGSKLWAGARGRFHENDGSGWMTHGLFTIYGKYDLNNTISEVRGLQPIPGGQVYLGVAEASLERRGAHLVLFEGSTVRDLPFNTIPQNTLRRLSFDVDGSLWVSALQFGVGKLTPTGIWFNYNRAVGDTNLTTRLFNWAFLADSEGTKWFGALSSPSKPFPLDELQDGLDTDYSNDVWTHHGVRSGGLDGLGSLNSLRALEDPAGNRWFLSNVTHSGQGWWGINILSQDKSAWRQVNPMSTLPATMASGDVPDVAFGAGGDVWVGFRKSGIQRWVTGGYDQTNLFDFSDDAWITIRKSEDFDDSDLLSLALRSDGILWIGTESEGVYKYNTLTGAFRQIPPNRSAAGAGVGLLGPRVADLVFDRDENLWVATDLGLNRIARDDDNDIASFTTPGVWQNLLNLFFGIDAVSPIVDADCRALAMHPTKNILYIGTSGGLSVLDLASLEAVASGLSNVYVYPNPILRRKGHQVLRIANITAPVDVEIYTIEGELVHSQTARNSEDVVWDLTTQTGFVASSGVYMVRISSGAESLVKMVSLIR